MKRRRTYNWSRGGFTLFEVIIALAIFLLSLVAITQLVNLAVDRAQDIRLQLQATQLCQTKLAELAVGIVPLAPQADVAFLDEPDWHWTVECQPSQIRGLWEVCVTVIRLQPNGSRSEWSLGELILDPALHGNRLNSASAVAGAGLQNPRAMPASSRNLQPGATPAP
jgi:general secretion pathway protein I